MSSRRDNILYYNSSMASIDMFPLRCSAIWSIKPFPRRVTTYWFMSWKLPIGLHRGPFYLHGLISNPAWIMNHKPSKKWDEITYPFKNFSGASVQVLEWISNLVISLPLYNGCNYVSMLGFELSHLSKRRDPWWHFFCTNLLHRIAYVYSRSLIYIYSQSWRVGLEWQPNPPFLESSNEVCKHFHCICKNSRKLYMWFSVVSGWNVFDGSVRCIIKIDGVRILGHLQIYRNVWTNYHIFCIMPGQTESDILIYWENFAWLLDRNVFYSYHRVLIYTASTTQHTEWKSGPLICNNIFNINRRNDWSCL